MGTARAAIATMPGSGISRPGRLTRLTQNAGLRNRRNMVWSWHEPVNFGDWVGPHIFRARQGQPPLYHRLTRRTGGTAYVTAGSIMSHIQRKDAAIVWGSGIISRADEFARPRAIHAVRGPLTRERCLALGYDCPEVYGDPAILLPEYLAMVNDTPDTELGIVPHFVNLDEATALFGGRPDVHIIDVRRPIEAVIADILSCRAIVSSSLHGLIVAHTYGRPAGWIAFARPLKGDGVKFHDYYHSGGVADPPEPLVTADDTGTDDLLRLAHAAPVPDTGKLLPALLEACPF